MDELIQRLASGLDIDDGVANQFVGTILNLLKENVDTAQFEQLMKLLPGAAALLQGAIGGSDAGGGLLGGLAGSLGKSLGGDLGEAISGLGALSETGLSAGQLGQATDIFSSFVSERGGGDLATAIMESLPGMK